MAVLIAASQDILNEVACTPDVEGGIGPVKIGIPIVGADGRLAVSHPWTDVDRAWLESYLAEWIATGDAQVLDALPGDWQYPTEGL